MKRRILSILIVMALFLTSIPVSGAYRDEAIFEVNSFGIIQGDENGNLRLDDEITRGEFSTMVIRLLGYQELAENRSTMFVDVPASHIHSGAIALISEFGYIIGDGEDRFNPDSPIKVQDCLKILVNALGYEIAAKAKGGYPMGYLAIANQLKLTRNLEHTIEENAIRRDVVSMMYAALDVDMLEDSGKYNGKYAASGGTLRERLAENEKIYHICGKVTADYYTWLVAPNDDIEKDEIEIDGIRYICPIIDTTPYLGRLTEVYFKEEPSGKKIILNMAVSQKNNEVVIDNDDDPVLFSNRITYHKNGAGNEITLAAYPTVVYNGRIITDNFEISGFSIVQGQYECIDADGDKKYDTVFINEYQSSVVDRVNSNGAIYVKAELPIYGIDYVAADKANEDVTFSIKDNYGRDLSIEDVKKGDVITVYKSKDNALTRIVITDKKVEGIIESYDDEQITLDGKEYNITDNITSEDIIFGNRMMGYLNEFDKLVYIEFDDDGKLYGFVTGYERIKGELNKYKVKVILSGDVINANEKEEGSEIDSDPVPILICKNSAVEIYDLADKVKLNNTGKKAKDALEELDAELPISFKLNSEGEISQIDSFYKVEFGSMKEKLFYNAKEMVFGGKPGKNDFAVEDGFTRVICIPEPSQPGELLKTTLANSSEDDLMSTVKVKKAAGATATEFIAAGFERDEDNGCVKLLVVRAPMKADAPKNVTATDEIGIVKKSCYVKDETDNYILSVTILNGDKEIELTVDEVDGSNGDIDNLEKGDFIIYATNNENNLVNAKIIKSLSGIIYHDVSGESNPHKCITGVVESIIRNDITENSLKRVNTLYVRLENGNIEDVRVNIKRNIPAIYIYNKENDSVTMGSIDDIMNGDVIAVSQPSNSTSADALVRAVVIVRGV